MMKRCIGVLALGCLACSFWGCGKLGRDAPAPQEELKDSAKNLVDWLAAGNFRRVASHFDDGMEQVLPVWALEDMWNDVINQAGAFRYNVRTLRKKDQGYDVVIVSCQFQRAKVNVYVTYNDAREVAGLLFVPIQGR